MSDKYFSLSHAGTVSETERLVKRFSGRRRPECIRGRSIVSSAAEQRRNSEIVVVRVRQFLQSNQHRLSLIEAPTSKETLTCLQQYRLIDRYDLALEMSHCLATRTFENFRNNKQILWPSLQLTVVCTIETRTIQLFIKASQNCREIH